MNKAPLTNDLRQTASENGHHASLLAYLFDIADIDSDSFPLLRDTEWDEFTQLAKQQKLYHYLGEWLLSRYAGELPDNVAAQLTMDTARNSARNALVLKQVTEIAALFADAAIPLVFMKGAACLARSRTSRSWRFLSDMDVIVPHEKIDDAVRLLVQSGYAPNLDQEPIPNSHHIVPFVHPGRASFIEVHTEPYGLSHYHSPSLPCLWRDAVTVEIDGIPVTVPSITDHLWILMRTDSIPRPYLPRLCDALEASHLLSVTDGEQLDVPLLRERAANDGCPFIVAGMSKACERYLGDLPFAIDINAPLDRWAGWTRHIERRYWRNRSDFDVSRNRFSALMFTTDRGLTPKLRYLARLIQYECNEDRATGTCLTHVPPLLVAWRTLKDIAAYIGIMAEYLALRLTGRV